MFFTFIRSFYPSTSRTHPVSALILHPREMQVLWSRSHVQSAKYKHIFLDGIIEEGSRIDAESPHTGSLLTNDSHDLRLMPGRRCHNIAVSDCKRIVLCDYCTRHARTAYATFRSRVSPNPAGHI